MLVLFSIWIGALLERGSLEEVSRGLMQIRVALIGASVLCFVIFIGGYKYIGNLLKNEAASGPEHGLMASPSRLNAFIESTEYVSIYSLDRELRYTGFNSLHRQEMIEYFHAEPREGEGILDLLPDDLRKKTLENYARALNGEHFTITSLVNDKYYTQIFNPIYDDKDKVTGITSSVFDVTDRIHAEQELERYKDQLEELVKERTTQLEKQSVFFQKVIDNLPNLLFVRDQHHKYVMVNQAMADSFGMKTGDFPGKTIDETHKNGSDAIIFSREDQEVLSDNRIVEEESQHRFPDGADRWLFLSKRRMEIGDESYVLGVHNDITSLKETELKLLEANHELKQTLDRLRATQMRLIASEKMASLGQLTAGLAHEINNPINYVAGNINPIRRDLDELREFIRDSNGYGHGGVAVAPKINYEMLFDELNALLDGVDEGAARVKSLMNDLNTFALPEGSRKVPYNINEAMKSTMNLVQPHLKKRITMEHDLGQLPLVFCNPGQISQVFLNIVNNAVQAIGGEGHIGIKTWKEDGYAAIEVADSGDGISEEILGKIFDPFFTTKDVGEGTGLGLSISYRIIEDHKGRIEVSNAEGGGAVFRIWLPIVS